MTFVSVIIWVLVTQSLGAWWWLIVPCIIFDLILLAGQKS